MRTGLVMPLLLFAPAAAAIEARDAHGLSVSLERIPEPVVVDGVTLRIQRAQGRDVPSLARRIEHRWRADGSQIRRSRAQGWEILSRWRDSHSEVIQWRGSGHVAQLLHSELDIRRHAGGEVRPPFLLPQSCAWGRVVQGRIRERQYLQRSAHCRSPVARLLPLLRASLSSQGWMLQVLSDRVLEVSRDGVHGSLLLAPGRIPAECALVWISTRDLPDPAS
jgi:hypothetical protein